MEICSYGHLFKYISNVTNITSKSYVHPSNFFKLIFQCSHKSHVQNAGQLGQRTTRTETSRPVSEHKSARKRGLVGPYVKTTRTVLLLYNIVQYLFLLHNDFIETILLAIMLSPPFTIWKFSSFSCLVEVLETQHNCCGQYLGVCQTTRPADNMGLYFKFISILHRVNN
jgi:hypothetical protein